MMKYILGAVAIFVIIGGGWYYMGGKQDLPADEMIVQEEQTNDAAGMTLPEGSGDTGSGIGGDTGMETGEGDAPAPATQTRTISVDAKNFSYSTKEIRVKRGEQIKLTLNVTDGFHDFVVDELNVRTEKIGKGASDSVVFIPEKTGTFEFYCSVGTHRQMGMVGKIIVE